jgi:hypothetical protein
MNERIRQIADEAAKYSATVFLPTGENGDDLFVEKFAELITQELQDEIWNRVVIESADSSEKYLIRGVVQSVLYDMNQNFGVEE